MRPWVWSTSVARLPRIVFSDIDGTLLAPDHTLSARTADAVRALVSRGVPFCLATGRMPSGTDAVWNRLGVSGPLICYSGGLVLDEDGEVISSETLSLDDARAVLGVIAHHWPRLCPSYFSGKHWYVQDAQAPAIVRESTVVHSAPEQMGFDQALAEERLPNKIFCSQIESPLAAREIARCLAGLFPHLAVTVYSSSPMFEVMPAGVTKATGMRALLGHLGIGADQALAFGDDANDVPMLEAAGLGVAMGNAAPAVRRAADQVCLTNAEDGVARYLETMLAECD